MVKYFKPALPITGDAIEVHMRRIGANSGDQLAFYGDSVPIVVGGIISLMTAVAIALGAVWLFASDVERVERDLVLALGILLFGGLVLIGVRSLFNRKPLLCVTHEGLQFNSTGVQLGLIPWADIASLSIVTIQSKRMLAIRVRTSYPLLSRSIAAIPPKMWLGWFALRATGSLTCSEGAFQLSLREVLEQIRQQFRKELHAHHVHVQGEPL